MSQSARLGYSFTPFPERAVQALATRRLSYIDVAILLFLYERADISCLTARRETPSMRLVQLAEGIGWPYTSDALSKRLRRLSHQPECWLTYEVKGGRGMYVFRLYPDPQDASDLSPILHGDGCPASESASRRNGMRSRPADSPLVVQLTTSVDPSARPTSIDGGPISHPAQSSNSPGDEVIGQTDGVRPPQTSQKPPTLSPKGGEGLAAFEMQGWTKDVRDSLARAQGRVNESNAHRRAPGDDGYLEYLFAAFENEQLTPQEWTRLSKVHQAICEAA